MKKYLFLVLSLMATGVANLNALPAQVILIRHAEKTADNESLNTKGRERAAALSPFFQEVKEFQSNGSIVAIYATHPSKANPSKKPIETVTPLAEALGLTIISEFDEDDYKKMVEEIKLKPEYKDKTVLICWNHQFIPEITRAFGALQSPAKWRSDIFDRLWIITLNKGGKTSFQNVPQKLMFGDSAN